MFYYFYLCAIKLFLVVVVLIFIGVLYIAFHLYLFF